MDAPGQALIRAIRGPLVDWLAERAVAPGGLPAFFAELCERLAAAGVPVWRATLGLERLHPEESGSTVIWRDGSLTREVRPRAGILTSDAYLRSPTRVVDETGRPFRRRLAAEGDLGMPLLEELRAEGATDYVMLPLAFVDTTRTAVVSFATKAPGGFADAAVAALDLAARLASPYFERAVLRKIAVDLLAAYLGPAAGRRVFDGHVERGDVETVTAAVWFCDLRGFTALSERLPRREVIALLNRFFDATGGAVEDHGGEILKFMGDGLLAVFPVEGDAGVTCARALDAAAAAGRAVEALAAEGGPALRFGLALHLGEVEFGNVGTRHRLDFTVIGPAVNHASRLEALTKDLGEPVLASAAFARAAARPMRRLGSFALRGVQGEVEVFAPHTSIQLEPF
jgi:adenylate cyclase